MGGWVGGPGKGGGRGGWGDGVGICKMQEGNNNNHVFN